MNRDRVGFISMLAALTDSYEEFEGDETLIGQQNFLDRLIDDHNFADRVADMLEVDTDKLVSSDYVSPEELCDSHD